MSKVLCLFSGGFDRSSVEDYLTREDQRGIVVQEAEARYPEVWKLELLLPLKQSSKLEYMCIGVRNGIHT